MGSRRTLFVLAVALVVLAALTTVGYAFSTRTLAAGSGDHGAWRVSADWKPWQTCIRATEANRESGACGLATPGTLTEASSFLVNDEGRDLTVVAGVVPGEASLVEVVVVGGDPVESRLVRVGLSRFFVAELPGRRSVGDLIARSQDGQVVERLENGPMPPPGGPAG